MWFLVRVLFVYYFFDGLKQKWLFLLGWGLYMIMILLVLLIALGIWIYSPRVQGFTIDLLFSLVVLSKLCSFSSSLFLFCWCCVIWCEQAKTSENWWRMVSLSGSQPRFTLVPVPAAWRRPRRRGVTLDTVILYLMLCNFLS